MITTFQHGGGADIFSGEGGGLRICAYPLKWYWLTCKSRQYQIHVHVSIDKSLAVGSCLESVNVEQIFTGNQPLLYA